MCTLEKIAFRSSADRPLTLYLWRPEGEVRGVVQLVHGMAEHIARYDRLARALCQAGYAVAGHSHIGHGEDAQQQELGYFGAKHGWDHLVQDVYAAQQLAKQRFPDKKYTILGHSMGSFVVREFLLRYGEQVDAAVICGTGWFPRAVCDAAMLAATLCGVTGGWQKPAPMVDRLMSKDNNKLFAPARTAFDWLSRDEAQVDLYCADPRCGFLFTARGYYDMFSGLRRLSMLNRLSALPKTLPVLFIAGGSDPVGAQGAGVRTVAKQFENAGVRDVTVKIYDGARHELFNEINRDEVTVDLIAWLDRHGA